MVRRKMIKVGVRQPMELPVFSDHKVSLRHARNALELKKQSALARAKQAEKTYNETRTVVGTNRNVLKRLKKKLRDDYANFKQVASAREDAHQKYRKRVRVTRRATKTMFPIPFEPII